MDVTVLGTSGAYPAAGRASSGYLVRHEGFNLVVDLGTGTLANLQRYVSVHDVHALLVSHEHPDHCLDVYPLFMARFFHGHPLDPIPFVAPAGTFRRVAALEDEEGVASMRTIFDVREVEPGAEFELGPFRVRTRPMNHLVPTLGMRLSVNGRSMAYTGDTGPTEELDELARDVDLFVSEASCQDVPKPQWFHLSARQAGEQAARSGVGNLMLSHFWPTHDRDRSREQAAQAYGGPLILAEENLRVEVGR